MWLGPALRPLEDRTVITRRGEGSEMAHALSGFLESPLLSLWGFVLFNEGAPSGIEP